MRCAVDPKGVGLCSCSIAPVVVVAPSAARPSSLRLALSGGTGVSQQRGDFLVTWMKAGAPRSPGNRPIATLNRAVASARVGTEVIRVRAHLPAAKAAEPAVRGVRFTVGAAEVFEASQIPQRRGQVHHQISSWAAAHGDQATVVRTKSRPSGARYYEAHRGLLPKAAQPLPKLTG